jgi:anaerobic selenocysteine-containing dehydrogenase
MPNSSRVVESLKGVENLIYFGLYENRTSELADIIIPAKTFLEKDDIRLSYGHSYFQKMRKVYDSNIGVSEYQFTKDILKILGKGESLKSKEEYLNIWRKEAKSVDGVLMSPDYEQIPYRDGFGEDGGESFIFIDDFDDEFEDIKIFRKFRKNIKKDESSEYWLLSPKYSKSINTQFKEAKRFVHTPPSAGFNSGDEVVVSSIWGEANFVVKVDDTLRDDTVLIYSSTPDVNILTPAILSEEGDSACFGEVKVSLKKL